MILRLSALLCLTLIFARPAYADPPRVVTDIAPVHSLVAMVMQDLGEPDLLMPPGVSPHDFALKPSDARNLTRADAVVWIGEGLTPGLARSIRSLAEDAASLELLEHPDTLKLPFRNGAVFEHIGGHDDHGDHKDHDDHAGHKDHNDHAGHKDHDEHDGHDHGEFDPHAWQDPENAKIWLAAIATLMGKLDPENAGAYQSNADTASRRIDALKARLTTELEPIQDRGFVVTHDAFHYFEDRFGISAQAAISPGDATPASAARLQAVSRQMQSDAPICIFIEPQMSQALTRTFAEEHGAKVGVLDPIGATLTEGPDLYLNLLDGIAQGLRDCLS